MAWRDNKEFVAVARRRWRKDMGKCVDSDAGASQRMARRFEGWIAAKVADGASPKDLYAPDAKNTDCGSADDDLPTDAEILASLEQGRRERDAVAATMHSPGFRTMECRSVALGSPAHVAVWDAINVYVQACGGRVDGGYGATCRQAAVVTVESALEWLLSGSRAAERGSVGLSGATEQESVDQGGEG